MSVSELLVQGMDLLVLGMGTVFAFLAILVLLVQQMSRLSQWLEARQPTPAPEPAKPAPHAQGAPGHDANITAVISAAVHRYRSRHNS